MNKLPCIELKGGFNNIDQVVSNSLSELIGGFGRAHIQVAIDLHRIGVDDFDVAQTGEQKFYEPGLADRGRAKYDDNGLGAYQLSSR